MSYEFVGQALREEYVYNDATFGATAVTHQIMGPRGCVGFVRDIMVDVATSLVGTTTVPEIDVGISSGDSTYGRYRLGTTASTGYGVGAHRASQEAITGNIPRSLGDFASHVVLDGGPYTSAGVAGGTFGTQIPQGRIPASPWQVTNVVSGTAGVCRFFLSPAYTVSQLVVGNAVFVSGVSGATGANGPFTLSAVNTSSGYVETTGSTFGGTYTAGGLVALVVYITNQAGVGSAAGGGLVRVYIDWEGMNVT
jgi:hypothetical protein